jgi:hypothetical protein
MREWTILVDGKRPVRVMLDDEGVWHYFTELSKRHALVAMEPRESRRWWMEDQTNGNS